jgi:ferredoxin-like protein FixX
MKAIELLEMIVDDDYHMQSYVEEAIREIKDMKERLMELSDSCNGCIYEIEDNNKRHRKYDECYECSRLYYDKYKAKDIK